MGSSRFVHLHLQSEFSLLRGGCRLDGLSARAAQLEMPAVAVTDRDALFGAVSFTRKAKAHGVRPILGAELSVSAMGAGGAAEVGDTDGAGANRRAGRVGRRTHPLVLLAEDVTGYRNLVRLVHQVCRGGFPPRRPLGASEVAGATEGLIALDGGWRGEAAGLLAHGRRDEARGALREWLALFGPDHFFVELAAHGPFSDPAAARAMAELAVECGVRTVVTNDVHYVERRDAEVVNALWALRAGTRLDDATAPRLPSEEFDLKSAEEMRARFDWAPDACARTLELAERCRVDLLNAGTWGGVDVAGGAGAAPAETADGSGRLLLPRFPVPMGRTSGRLLRELVDTGVSARYGGGRAERHGVRERAEHELSVIEGAGFTDYFLIVWDVVRHAKGEGIPVGPGRGSAAASLVAYALGITEVDPLRYDLIFERFLNPGRKTPPDIDLDFAPERRAEVVQYVVDRYGADRVAQIGTFGTFAARAAIREAGRLLGIPVTAVDPVAKAIPTGNGADGSLRRLIEKQPALRRRLEQAPLHGLLPLAERLEGLPRHLSVHAAGLVIAPRPLEQMVPTVGGGDGGIRVTQFPMDDIESLGLLKVDLLGLRTLSVIQDAARRVERRSGERLDPNRLPLDDPKVYEMLGRGEAAGVFQLETPMFRRILPRLKPSRFEDIIAALALGRPGPMDRLDEYVRRKDGEEPVPQVHPIVDAILRPSHGSLLYQEQVMRLATEVAGYTPSQADQLRRAMGKKRKDEMEAERARFLRGAHAREFPPEVAKTLFAQMARFAEYAFNVAHSAAYALITYQTAYLRAHHPAEFMAAELSSVIGSQDRVRAYIKECRKMGLRVLPADVNESGVDFEVEGGAVRVGLAAVKHVGRQAAEALIRARGERGRFVSWEALAGGADRQHVGRRALQSLAEAGAAPLPFHIELEISERYEDALERVATLLRKHRGKVPVRLCLRDARAGRSWIIALGEEWRVDPSDELGEELGSPPTGAIFGEDAVF